MDSVFLRNRPEDWATDDVMTYPYKKSDLVYICISTTARAISQVPIKVYKQVGEEEYRALPRKDPWQLRFERPNYLMDRYSFVESIIGHLMLDGDVFIVPFPPGSSLPASLWVVRKKFMGPIRDRQTNQLIGWNYNVKGVFYDSYGGTTITEGAIPLSVEEVCHIYFWNPYDTIMGLAPIEAGKLNVMIDYKASHYTANFFDDGAVPGGMLETDRSLSDKQFQRILNQFETKHGGYKKGHRMALLENGLKYTQTGLTQKDMEFPKLRDLSFRRVCQIYGMKEAVVSETKSVNRATGQEERAEWWESTNLPIMRMSASALNFTLFPQSDLKCQFDTTTIEALRESLRGKTETGYKLWQMGAPFNEVNQRLDLGFKRLPWGDTWYMPVNLVDVSKPTPVAIVAPPPGQQDYIDYEEKKLLPLKTETPRGEVIWNTIIRRSLPLEESFSKKVSRVFYDMRKRTLELLYRKKNLDEVEKDLDDLENELYGEEYKELRKVIVPLYKQALLLGVELVIAETGFEMAFDLTDPESIYFLTNKELKIQGVIQTVKEQIRKEIIEGYQGGESIDQIADRIRGVFDIAKSRARTIARTEVIGSVNEGRFLAMNRSGFREQEWFTAMDERVRAQHLPMHGKKIKVGEMWVMPDGSSLRHPGDWNASASQIINCRCCSFVVPGSHYTERD